MFEPSDQVAIGAAPALIEPASLCTWEIPNLTEDSPVTVQAVPGNITVIVGPNGSGKSALGHWLQQHAAGATVRRVIAHRRLWFEYAGPDISFGQREQLATAIPSWGAQLDSRWRDHAQAQRPAFVLFDLLAHINDYNARFVHLIEQGAQPDRIQGELGVSPLIRINTILANAHLAVTLKATDRASFEAITGDGIVPYPISEMSDGEKSALLLSAEVATVSSGTVVIIDEPERHLHRLISASLIEAIADDRPDCHFVVLTHDLDLAASLPRNSANVAVLARMAWADRQPVGWELRVLDQDADIPESARRAILGGRRRVLFLEGERHSLDLRLYEVLYPDWTLMPVGGCDQVIRSVAGLLASETHHWVHGRGIVDGDGRGADERASLSAKGVLALALSEVESAYYSEVVRRSVAIRQGETLSKQADELLDGSTQNGLTALRREHGPSRMAASVAEKIVSRRVFEDLPSRAQLQEGIDPITVSTPSPFPTQLAQLNRHLREDDLESVVRKYPIRDTSLRAEVAASLGFRTIQDYEAAALARIRSDGELADAVRNLVGPLPKDVALPVEDQRND